MTAPDSRESWMQQYAYGVATAETLARLEKALGEDTAFRAMFLEYLNRHVYI